ncbi:MAG: hypothetical protein M3Q27_08100 [Actinomycetota bacterium]|nr:hypothetical protein [Actinomycetota bacterium]
MSSYPDAVDPEIVGMVQSIRDRFGLRGLEAAATLIHEEMVRTAPVFEQLSEE